MFTCGEWKKGVTSIFSEEALRYELARLIPVGGFRCHVSMTARQVARDERTVIMKAGCMNGHIGALGDGDRCRPSFCAAYDQSRVFCAVLRNCNNRRSALKVREINRLEAVAV